MSIIDTRHYVEEVELLNARSVTLISLGVLAAILPELGVLAAMGLVFASVVARRLRYE